MAHRHRRVTAARRTSRAALVAAPLALLAGGAAVATGHVPVGVVPTVGSSEAVVRSPATDTGNTRETGSVSRSDSRLAAARGERLVKRLQSGYDERRALEATTRAVRHAHVHRWTTAALKLWTGSDADARDVGLVEEGEKVLATGRRSADRAEIVVAGQARWVTAAYLSPDRPASGPVAATPSQSPSHKPSHKPSQQPSQAPSAAQSASASASPETSAPSPQGLSTAPCPDGSVESGLTSSAVRVYRAVCHAFPQVNTYLGYDAHGEHASGKAIDIMISDVADGKALGDRIASFLQSHASQLDLYDVIWWDRIWTPVRASEGWRDYGDHGSPTANHMDHVHVSTN